MKSYKEIPYEKIKHFKPFFTEQTLDKISAKDKCRLIFLLCDTVKRMSADIQKLKGIT